MVGVVLVLAAGGLAPTVAPARANPITGLLGHCSYGGDGQVSHHGPYRIGKTEVVSIPSSVDGEPIEIGVVHPAVPAGFRSPVVMNASSYVTADLKSLDLASCMPELVKNLVPWGYSVAFVPTRGTSGSGGCADMMGPLERADLSKAVTWLGTQSWSNGRVGMIGISYDGSTPWDVAATGNPHLATIVPLEGVNDLPDLVFGRGRNDWRWWFFAAGYYGEYGYATNNPVASDRDPALFARSLNCPSLAAGLAATAESNVTGEPDAGGYWAARNNRPSVERKYHGSVFLVQGLDDWNVTPGQQYPWINKLRDRGTPLKVLMGQWQHAWPDASYVSKAIRRPDFPDMLLNWFDRWLKNDRSVDTGPPVEVQDSSLQWHRQSAWPATGTRDNVLYGSASGALEHSPSAPTATALLAPNQQSRYVYLSDNSTTNGVTLPSSLETLCGTCAVFRLPPASRATRVSGQPRVDLDNVVPSGPGGVVSAFLYALTADGQAKRLGWGDVDLRFPSGQTTGQPVQSGKAMKASVTFQAMDAVVPAGANLVLILSQGNANHGPVSPRFPVQLTYGKTMVGLHLPVPPDGAATVFTPRH